MNKTNVPVRDFTYFVYDLWGTHETWASRTTRDNTLETQARNYFWQRHGEQIREALQPWLDQGYQFDGVVDARWIKICLTREYQLPLDIIDLLMWVMSFGVLLVMEMLSGQDRTMAEYRPIEFRIRLTCPVHPIRDPLTVYTEELVSAA